jgi:hypothetical protein
MDIYNVNIKFKFDKKYALDIEKLSCRLNKITRPPSDEISQRSR